MDKIDTLETEWLSYLLANRPWAYINKGCCRLEKEKRDVLDVNEWMYRGKGKRNCAQPHLSGKENRVHIETKGAFYGGAIFCAAISACWFRGIILKNSWCNSLPGTPGCSRDQSSHILKLDVFRLLPTESFSRPVPVRLFTDAPFVAFNPPTPPLAGVDVCAVTSMSASARRGQQWTEIGKKYIK